MDKRLNDYRNEIDAIDQELRILYKKRLMLSRKIGIYKKELGIDVFDEQREAMMKAQLIKQYKDDIDLFSYIQLNETMLELSRRIQDEQVEIEMK